MFEGPSKIETEKSPESFEVLKVRNEIQHALIMTPMRKEDKESEDKRNEYAQAWIEKYSLTGIFRKVFDKYFSENPDLLENWNDINNLDSREDILREFENLLEKYDPKGPVDLAA